MVKEVFDMDIDDVIKFLCDHNIRLIDIDQDKNEATITERYGSVTSFEMDLDIACSGCSHTACECDECSDCAESPCSCAKCTYCGSRPCVC